MARLHQFASQKRASELFVVREPAEDTDYSQWGQRLFSAQEIDVIIHQSGLIQPKESKTIEEDLTETSSVKSAALESEAENVTNINNKFDQNTD